MPHVLSFSKAGLGGGVRLIFFSLHKISFVGHLNGFQPVGGGGEVNLSPDTCDVTS